MIAIIDYGMGNKHSVYNALSHIGVDAIVTKDEKQIRSSDRFILPGVGAFGAAIENLNKSGLKALLDDEVKVKGKPFLGICLGMQLLAEKGTEKGVFEGLGWIEGCVEKLNPEGSDLKIPHVGWNDILLTQDSPMFKGLKKDMAFYFVHSYAYNVKNTCDIAAECNYGGIFTAAVMKDNIFATQFHPEKSQKNGLLLLENFANWRV